MSKWIPKLYILFWLPLVTSVTSWSIFILGWLLRIAFMSDSLYIILWNLVMASKVSIMLSFYWLRKCKHRGMKKFFLRSHTFFVAKLEFQLMYIRYKHLNFSLYVTFNNGCIFHCKRANLLTTSYLILFFKSIWAWPVYACFDVSWAHMCIYVGQKLTWNIFLKASISLLKCWDCKLLLACWRWDKSNFILIYDRYSSSCYIRQGY